MGDIVLRTGFQAQVDSKEKTLQELKDNLNEMSTKVQETTVALRLSHEERERLAKELTSMGNDLNKLVQENTTLEQKNSTAYAELEDLRAKCKKRKADAADLEEQFRTTKANYEKAEAKLVSSEHELAKLRDELQKEIRAGEERRNDFERQLRQSQENFERQLNEATQKFEVLSAQKAEVEAELGIAANNMRTLECQVQERDALLEKRQLTQGKWLGNSWN